MLAALLGNATAERVLLYLTNYGSGHSNAIAKTFGIAPSQVYKQMLRLEEAGVLIGRFVGRTRVYEFNPRYTFKDELKQLLEKALRLLPPEETRMYYRDRGRPRRLGKEL